MPTGSIQLVPQDHGAVVLSGPLTGFSSLRMLPQPYTPSPIGGLPCSIAVSFASVTMKQLLLSSNLAPPMTKNTCPFFVVFIFSLLVLILRCYLVRLTVQLAP